MKKSCFFIAIAVFLVLASPLCRAQRDFLVKGQVVCHGPCVGLEGAKVELMNSDVSVYAGAEGKYELTVPSWKKNGMLKASYEGCIPDVHSVGKWVNFELFAKDLQGLLLFILKYSSNTGPEGYGPDGPALS